MANLSQKCVKVLGIFIHLVLVTASPSDPLIHELVKSGANIYLYADIKFHFEAAENWFHDFQMHSGETTAVNGLAHVLLIKSSLSRINSTSFGISIISKIVCLRYSASHTNFLIWLIADSFPIIERTSFLKNILDYYRIHSKVRLQNFIIDYRAMIFTNVAYRKNKTVDQVLVLKRMAKLQMRVFIFVPTRSNYSDFIVSTICSYYQKITMCSSTWHETRRYLFNLELTTFQKQITNMNGWAIIIKTTPLVYSNALCPYPYSLVRVEHAIKVLRQVGSKSFCLLEFLQTQFNFSLSNIRRKEKNIDSILNFSPDFISANILNYMYGSANIAIMARLNLKRKEYVLVPSIFDTNENLEYAMVLQEALVPSFATFFNQPFFDKITWFAIVFTVVLVVTILQTSMRPASISTKIDVLMWILGVLLDQASELKGRKDISFCIIIAVWFFETFELRNLYSAGIYAIVTVSQKPNLPSSYEDAYFGRGIPVFYFSHIIHSDGRPAMQNYVYPSFMGCDRRCNNVTKTLPQCRCVIRNSLAYKLRRQLITAKTLGRFLHFLVKDISIRHKADEGKTKNGNQNEAILYTHLPECFMLVNVPEYLSLLKMITEALTSRKVFKTRDSKVHDVFNENYSGKVWMIHAGPLTKNFAHVIGRIVEAGIYDIWGKYVTRLKKGIRVYQGFKDFKEIVINETILFAKTGKINTRLINRQSLQNFAINSWLMSVIFESGSGRSVLTDEEKSDCSSDQCSLSANNFQSVFVPCGILFCICVALCLAEILVQLFNIRLKRKQTFTRPRGFQNDKYFKDLKTL